MPASNDPGDDTDKSGVRILIICTLNQKRVSEILYIFNRFVIELIIIIRTVATVYHKRRPGDENGSLTSCTFMFYVTLW